MKKSVRVTKDNQRNGNINKFITPEMRQNIVRLRRELDDCKGRLSDHFYVMNEVQEGLIIALECAECLLTSDPFAAWEKQTKRKQKKFDDISELEDAPRPPLKGNNKAATIYKATGNVTKLVTSEMRRRIVELKDQLDEYAACLREAGDDMLELESLNRAVGLADEMKCVNQLESCEARKEREQRAEEDEESLGDL